MARGWPSCCLPTLGCDCLAPRPLWGVAVLIPTHWGVWPSCSLPTGAWPSCSLPSGEWPSCLLPTGHGYLFPAHWGMATCSPPTGVDHPAPCPLGLAILLPAHWECGHPAPRPLGLAILFPSHWGWPSCSPPTGSMAVLLPMEQNRWGLERDGPRGCTGCQQVHLCWLPCGANSRSLTGMQPRCWPGGAAIL